MATKKKGNYLTLKESRAIIKYNIKQMKYYEGLKKKNGYCPCRLEMTPENKCICEEFRQQMADPDFEGYCHCMLYYKSK